MSRRTLFRSYEDSMNFLMGAFLGIAGTVALLEKPESAASTPVICEQPHDTLPVLQVDIVEVSPDQARIYENANDAPQCIAPQDLVIPAFARPAPVVSSELPVATQL